MTADRAVPGNRGGWPLSVRERLLLGAVVTPSGCWEWTEGRTPSGYGKVKIGPQTLSVHRLAYEVFVGPIPDGLMACHHCDNRPCINPAHLFTGTAADNAADMVAKSRQRSLHGEGHPSSRLTDERVREIRRRVAEGHPARLVARDFGVARSTVNRVVDGRSWRHVA